MADDSMALGYALGQDSNNSNGGFGGGAWEGIWGIIILAMIFGWGNGGWGGFGGFGGGGSNSPGLQGLATRADINEGFALNGITNGITAIQQGICDSTYAVTNAVNNGFHGVDNAVCNLGYNMQTGFNSLGAQLAQCCCDNREAISQVRYDMAAQACDTRNTIQNTTRDIIDNQNAGTRAILDFMTQDKISSLQAENQALKFQASQSAQNAFITASQDAQTAELIRRCCPTPVPAYTVPAPYPYGYSGNCGCGC